MATIAAAIVAAVALIVVFTRPDGSSNQQQGEIFLQPAASSGPDPFTESTARKTVAPPRSSPSGTSSATGNVAKGVDGSAPGLYGGTRSVASCDVEKQISALKEDPAKNKAFASALGIAPSEVPSYLRGLTPVQLQADTRVTNHGYRNGAATSYQAVLQAGTAVLVDDRGVPRVRCACGNPLKPPVAQKSNPKRTGDSWPGYQPTNTVVVVPAPRPVKEFVVPRQRRVVRSEERRQDGRARQEDGGAEEAGVPAAGGVDVAGGLYAAARVHVSGGVEVV